MDIKLANKLIEKLIRYKHQNMTIISFFIYFEKYPVHSSCCILFTIIPRNIVQGFHPGNYQNLENLLPAHLTKLTLWVKLNF